jgi:hypothetical protein
MHKLQIALSIPLASFFLLLNRLMVSCPFAWPSGLRQKLNAKEKGIGTGSALGTESPEQESIKGNNIRMHECAL